VQGVQYYWSPYINITCPCPPQAQIMGTHDYVCVITCSTTWLSYQPGRICKALTSVNRIRHTPPELRNELHQRALDCWMELQAMWRWDSEREEQGKVASRPREPSPYDDNATWKRWLRDMREHPRPEGKKFLGVPCVCQGYQAPHIEAARALLGFLTRHKGNTARGPLRNAFLHNAAMLLCVPEPYQRVTTQLPVRSHRRARARNAPLDRHTV